MNLLPLTLLLAAAACATAEIGSLLMECRSSDWHIYQSKHEASCIRLMSEPRLFNQAYKDCFSLNGRLLSLNHRRRKLEFVNDLIMKHFGNESVTLWNFESVGVHESLVSSPPGPSDWLVMKPNRDVSRIELVPNSTDVMRNFVCETPARLTAQTPRFSVEPEDLLISAELLNQRKPFFATFNCLAFALPKPQLRWVLVRQAEREGIETRQLRPKMISEAREPLSEIQAERPAFFDLRVNCSLRQCNDEGVQQRSQLVVMNPQLLDPKIRVACVASNEFGAVMSREARTVATRMSSFQQQQQSREFSVTVGGVAAIPCSLEVEPDAAAVEWFRVEGGSLVPLEQLNRQSLGGLQMSRATFDLLIDWATVADSGEYVCRLLMRNGRVRQIWRDLTIKLKVVECVEDCDLQEKPVMVVPGYPAVLSMNPMSNSIVRSGDDFLLECPCVGKRDIKEELTVTWKMTVSDSTPLKVKPDGSALLFRSAGQRHSGVFSCQCVRDNERSAWSSVEVRVTPAILPLNFTETVTRRVNDTVTIGCDAPDVEGVQVKVIPMKRDRSLLGVKDSRMTLSATDSGFSLRIRDLRPDDSDTYGCRISSRYFNRWTESDTFYTTLIVKK